jgi:hypothetical protein
MLRLSTSNFGESLRISLALVYVQCKNTIETSNVGAKTPGTSELVDVQHRSRCNEFHMKKAPP